MLWFAPEIVLLITVQVESVYFRLAGLPVNRLAGIKLLANRHNGPTGKTCFHFSSLQTLVHFELYRTSFNQKEKGAHSDEPLSL